MYRNPSAFISHNASHFPHCLSKIRFIKFLSSHGESFRLNIPSIKTKIGSRELSVTGPKVFNSLPRNIRNVATIEIF